MGRGLNPREGAVADTARQVFDQRGREGLAHGELTLYRFAEPTRVNSSQGAACGAYTSVRGCLQKSRVAGDLRFRRIQELA